MFSEEEAEVLRTLMADLQEALKRHKARHVVESVRDAYMRAAFNRNQIERHRAKETRRMDSRFKNAERIFGDD